MITTILFFITIFLLITILFGSLLSHIDIIGLLNKLEMKPLKNLIAITNTHLTRLLFTLTWRRILLLVAFLLPGSILVFFAISIFHILREFPKNPSYKFTSRELKIITEDTPL